MATYTPKVIAVSLNPSIDRGIEIPDFTIGAHQMGIQRFRRPAGKAANLAQTLGTFKVPTMLLGFIGKGQQDYFERYLNSEYVFCQLFATPGKTRENITIFDPVKNVETHIRDRGFEVTLADINKLRKKLALLCHKDTIVAFSGSLPPGFSIEDFLELVQICQMNEAKVCVDSSGKVLRACLPLGVWMMKPNKVELAEMLDREIQTDEQIIAAGETLKDSVAMTIVTLGKKGSFLFSSSEDFMGHVPLDPRLVKNTVGCGDSMLAGFLAGITSGLSIRESFKQALAVATAAAVSLAPGHISAKDVELFAEQTEISTIAKGAI